MACDDEPWFAAWKTWPCCCCSWGSPGVGGGWCWKAGTWSGDGVCMLGAGPGAAVIPGWRDRDGTVTGGAGTGGAGTGGGLATGGAAACAVMADSILVLEPADDAVVVVIVGAGQHTEVVVVVGGGNHGSRHAVTRTPRYLKNVLNWWRHSNVTWSNVMTVALKSCWFDVT